MDPSIFAPNLPVTSLESQHRQELLPLWCDTAFELPMVASPLGEAQPNSSVVSFVQKLGEKNYDNSMWFVPVL